MGRKQTMKKTLLELRKHLHTKKGPHFCLHIRLPTAVNS